MVSKLLKSEQGQSLIEVIVAATVGILVVTALTFATIFSLRNANFAKNSEQATKLAQEGIERVRTGRDRNAGINNLASSTDCPNVSSWNGDITGSGSVWSCKIYAVCTGGANCYFKFNPSSPNELNFLISSVNFPSLAENIPPMFQRAVILSDDLTTYGNQKTVSVIVKWNDFSGVHESRLSTILRKI